MPEIEPGVRRMCMAVAGRPGLLASACVSAEFDRIYIFPAPGGGAEAAVAPPGIDEAGLAADLVHALRAGIAANPAPDTALLALHVGIVRVYDDGFAGSAVDRVLRLVRGDRSNHPAPAPPPERAQPGLFTTITEPLFADLLGEGWPAEGWRLRSPAGVWCKRYPPLPPAAAVP